MTADLQRSGLRSPAETWTIQDLQDLAGGHMQRDSLLRFWSDVDQAAVIFVVRHHPLPRTCHEATHRSIEGLPVSRRNPPIRAQINHSSQSERRDFWINETISIYSNTAAVHTLQRLKYNSNNLVYLAYLKKQNMCVHLSVIFLSHSLIFTLEINI